MLDIILHEMEGLSPGEKGGPIDATKAAAARGLAHAAGDAAPEACPWCGSSSIRKGHDRDGSQRRPCRGCGCTFSAKGRGLPRLPASLPALPHEALRGHGKIAPALSGRAFGLLAGRRDLSRRVPPTGSGARSTAGMPGAPRRHGGAVHARGISGLKACIACGADGAGDGLCRLADRGRPTDEALEEAIEGLGAGTWAAAGTRQGCRRALPAPGIAEHAAARTDLQEDGKKTEASSFRKTPPGQCSCLVSFIRSRSLRRSSS